MPIDGISTSLIAAIIYAAGTGIWKALNDQIHNAVLRTARHFKKNEKVKFHKGALENLLKGEAGKAAIEKFRIGEGFIDGDELAEHFLEVGGIDITGRGVDESRQLARDIFAHFIRTFTNELLLDRKKSAQTLHSFMQVYHEMAGVERSRIMQMIKDTQAFLLEPIEEIRTDVKEIKQAVLQPSERVRQPFDLPPRPEHFTGREEEVEWLLARLWPGQVAAICGSGGIGKTAIAAETVHRYTEQVKERFPNGVIFHSFYRDKEAGKCLEHIARYFNVDTKQSPDMAARMALNGRKVLLFLDGCEDADRLDRVKDVAGGCGVIVTSRKKDDADTRTSPTSAPSSTTGGCGVLAAFPSKTKPIPGTVP